MIEEDYASANGEYFWYVPNKPTTTALVKVTDANNGVIVDQSDAPFTITRATPKLTAPNTNVGWIAGTTQDITWAYALISTTVCVLEYSIDSGATWTTIVSGTSNDGHYSWNVPNQPSTECLIRVSEFGNPSINDVSDLSLIHI